MVVHVYAPIALPASTVDDPDNDDDDGLRLWFRFAGPTGRVTHKGRRRSPRPAPIPGPVCRQFLVEASAVFYSYCIFSFEAPRAFYALARLNLACVPRICKIAINLMRSGYGTGHSVENFPYKWRNAFTVSFVGRFRSLEGVSISGLVKWDFADTGDNPDILNDPVWEATEMSTMIEAFQQHELKPELTTVSIQREWDRRH
jgi:hypothetical protein